MSNTPDFVKKVTGAAKEFAEAVADKAEDAFEVISDKAEDAMEAVKEKGDQLRERRTPHLNLVREMYGMIGQGQLLEAFEKYYAENVVVQENNEEPRRGKDASREWDKQFLATVKEIHGGGTRAVTSNEETGHTMVEAWMDVTFQDGNRVMLEEVAVQKWEDGLIVHERFYYNRPM